MKTKVGRNLLRDARQGTVTDAQVKYIAWGNGSVAISEDDTTLENELGRHALTSRVAGGVGILDMIAYLSQEDAVTTITRVGFFAGATATAAANSGVMTDVFEYSKTKTALVSWQLDLHDLIEAGV
jgi:hypothetical protein